MSQRTLLQKYNIPLSHLDFSYIRDCNNVKEMERIVKILNSGEEGYYSDLTKCAEEKLLFLKPESKILRKDEPALTKSSMDTGEWSEINNELNEWTKTIKEKDEELRSLPNKEIDPNFYPPIRQIKEITTCEEDTNKSNEKRITSLEYDKWDKYDADTAILKMDLDEEQKFEKVAIAKKYNEKCKKIEEITTPNYDRMAKIEREVYAKQSRERGNGLFKLGDYAEAVNEYTKSIELLPTAHSYNNRAIAYIKLNRNTKAIADCESCLSLEPRNIKAMLRKGQALLNDDNRRKAYEVYCQVISIDPTNVLAQNHINSLKGQLPNLPPANAYRMKIIDEDCSDNDEIDETTVKEKIFKNQLIDQDYSQLIIPNKIKEKKLLNFKKLCDTNKTTKSEKITNPNPTNPLSLNILASQRDLIKKTQKQSSVIIEEIN